MQHKPEILETRLIAKSRLFGIEEMKIRFSNGAERTYERLRTPPIAAVMMVPLLDDDTVVLIREYGAGLEEYQLTLPKGALDDGEDWREAADRELREEAGYGAGRLTLLKRMTLSPGYMGHQIRAVLAEDLFPAHLARRRTGAAGSADLAAVRAGCTDTAGRHDRGACDCRALHGS